MKFNKIREAIGTCYDGIKTVAGDVKDKTYEYAGKAANVTAEVVKVGKDKAYEYVGKVERYLKTPKGIVAMTPLAVALAEIGTMWVIDSLVAAGITSVAAATAAKAIIGGMVFFGIFAASGISSSMGAIFGSLMSLVASMFTAIPLLPIIIGLVIAMVVGQVSKSWAKKMSAEEDLIDEGYMGA